MTERRAGRAEVEQWLRDALDASARACAAHAATVESLRKQAAERIAASVAGLSAIQGRPEFVSALADAGKAGAKEVLACLAAGKLDGAREMYASARGGNWAEIAATADALGPVELKAACGALLRAL